MSAVAVLQTAFIGDVVLATPLLESARRSCPGDSVVAVVRAGCENLIENNPYADEILIWDKRGRGSGVTGLAVFSKRLRDHSIHTALIPHRSLRTALAAMFSGIRTRIGFSRGGGSFLHTSRVPYRYGIHEVERNLMLAEAAGGEHTGFRPSIFPDDRDRETIDGIISPDTVFCVFAPGSVWPTKMWPAEQYIETGRSFAGKGIRIVLSGGEADRGVCGEISGSIPGSFDVSGHLTLRQSAELYRRSLFILTGDTAPQHIGAAMDARVFALFGPTVREFGFWPYTDRGTVIEESLECRPCGAHGHHQCPERTHLCMRRITPVDIIRTIDETIQGKEKPL
jgi:heptosyltransferase-2